MRTTVTLDPDVVALLRKVMGRRGVSFKQAINEAIRAGLADGGQRRSYETPSFPMGEPAVPLTHALRLAAELEDEEIVRELGVRK